MIENVSLLSFVAASLVVLLIPGPGVFYIVARSLSQGRRAGLASILGLSTGALVHVAAATLGLSAILLASATAFTIVKFLGASYLIYLGIRTLLEQPNTVGVNVAAARSAGQLFRDGVVICVLNPKVAVFFLAFLPQFVETGRGSVQQQVLLLGLVYVAIATITDSAYVLLAGRLQRWYDGRGVSSRLPRLAGGLVYIGLGVTTALANRR
jgi:threonine/homoserine/homoserine lactone efflux protein